MSRTHGGSWPVVSIVWYGMVYVDLYSAIVANDSNVLCMQVPRKQPSFQALFEGANVLLCAEVVRQSSKPSRNCTANARRPTVESPCCGATINCCVADRRCHLVVPPHPQLRLHQSIFTTRHHCSVSIIILHSLASEASMLRTTRQ